MSVVLFCLLMHVPLRLEAVIKILSFGVFLFPYVLILIESSDALPVPLSLEGVSQMVYILPSDHRAAQ